MPTSEILRFPFPVDMPAEPPAEFTRLRATDPVVSVELPTGDRAWLVTRYADNLVVLGDPRFSRAATVAPGAPRLLPLPPDPTSIIAMDPPEHTRLRTLVARSFTNLRVKGLRPRVQALVDGMLDEVAAAGPPFDVVPGIAQQLPVAVICELLGVPPRDGPYFRDLAEVILSLTTSSPAQVGEARSRFSGYLDRLVAQKRAEPGDDLISDLVRAGDEHEALSAAETISMARTLLLAGAHTTANELALSCLVLLRRPERWAMLLERPELLRPAVEELLRYNSLSTSGGFLRIAREDVELGGVTIRAGEAVLPSIVSANRDPTIFAAADELVLDRPRNAHLTFGHGLHHCLGAHLARAELEITIGTLLRRFPTLHLPDVDGRPEVVGTDVGQLLRGIPRLLVAW